MPFALNINGAKKTVDTEPDTPLLWVLRDTLSLKGTKFGCGLGLCFHDYMTSEAMPVDGGVPYAFL